MERVGDILRALGPLPNTSRGSTPTSSNDSDEPREEPVCPICKGAGLLRIDVLPGHPDFGKVVPCRCRSEALTQERLQRLQRLSNLGPLLRLTFDNLIKEGRHPDPGSRERFKATYNLCLEYAKSPSGWLVLMGPSGCGKTHLAAAIANERIRSGESALFVVVPDLLDHLRASFSPTSDVPYDELFENVKASPLLILDDLGTQSSTPWAQEKLFQIFNHRYNAQLPTVITTNRNLDEIDERLRSRMTDPALSRVCQVEERQSAAQERFSSELPELLKGMTFENFDPRGQAVDAKSLESLKNAFKLSREFAENPHLWLVLLGTTGCGKTHLAAAIANQVIARGQPVYFVVVPDLLDHLRSAYSPDSKVPYDELFETIRTAPLLILDDLGAHSSTPWAEEKLYQLVNHRYNHRLPTVITTNLALDELDERLASRLADVRVSLLCPITAPTFRASPPLKRSRQSSGARTRRRGDAGMG
ncbi:MAG: ATP-binding protein [Chloroflexota bacterium]|jgi:DNA replication protein DnaC